MAMTRNRPRHPGRAASSGLRRADPGRPAGPEAMLFGLHAVGAAWVNPARTCLRLAVTEAAAEALRPALDRAAAAGLDRPAPQPASREAIDRLLPPGSVHQGAALEALPLDAFDLDDLGRGAALDATAAIVVLDQVTDPHNVGAVLRSAAAFGAKGVVVTERHAPMVTGTLAKAASGAVEHVPLVRVGNLAQGLRALKDWNFWCIGLAEEAPATLAEADLGGRVALLLGAEGAGLRRLTRELCDALVRLPTGGPIGSLNVSNAAAVALYEWARRRPAPG